MNEGTDPKGPSRTPLLQISLSELFQTLVAEFEHAKPVQEVLAKVAAYRTEIFTGKFTISGTEGFAHALALIAIKDILMKQATDPVLIAITEAERSSEAVYHDLKVLTEYLDLHHAPIHLAWYPMLAANAKRDLNHTFERTLHHYRRQTNLLIKKELTAHMSGKNFNSNIKPPPSSKFLSLIVASTEAAHSCDHLASDTDVLAPLRLVSGKKFDRKMLLAKLTEWGYVREHYANEPGEVALRGDICEVFAPNATTPLRIYFFGDEIEVIKQAPLRNENAKTEHSGTTDSSSSKWITLTECLLSPFITKPPAPSKTLLDLPTWTRAYHKNVFVLKFESFHRTDSKRHFHFPTLPAYNFNNQLDKIAPTLKRYTDECKANYIFTANPLLTKMLLQLLATLPLREARCSFEKEVAERPLAKPRFMRSPSLEQKKNRTTKNWIAIGEESLSGGFMGAAVNVWTAEELFGKRMARRSLQVTAASSHAPENFWETFLALEKDDYVVHLHHGIGIYRGIERLTVSNREKDYFKIEYQDQAKLFIPVEQIKLIQKYIGDRTQVRIDALGKNHWNKVKERARKVAERIAKKLFALYTRRTALRVSPLPKEDYFQTLFEMRFPYEESRDQMRAVDEIRIDLEKDVPMDRLLCADVGYGKTEVALRAIFKVAMAGRQTLVLIPTTLLAMQHYETFSERFKTTPVRVAVLSRFTTAANEKTILTEVQTGKIDVLLSTHKGLTKKVKFHKLALLVIDEEQKFGVNQKEMMRELYPAVHVLSLSATPIPRTLHLSLSSFRSLSFITTPILGRRPVHTTVAPFDEQVVKKAFAYEHKRNGQCYFIYNYVQTLATFEATLKKILPSAKILSIHAQLDKSLIEHRFHLFRSGAYNVLLSTNIVDAGLDLPRVNTILVYDAHRFGLAQLYQLKGRVGRSDRQAYAYLFYPQNIKIGMQARQRLNCLVRYAQLGSGYQIAIKDLELRGAGNLLGIEQSGTVAMVGLEFFSNLLRDVVEALHHKHNTLPLYYEPVIELSYKAYIPDDYIRMPAESTASGSETSKDEERTNFLGDNVELTDVTAIKGTLYRKIMTARSRSVLRTLQKTLGDEYGKIPKVMEGLFAVSAIKILAKRLRVLALIEKDDVLELRFLSTAKLCHVNIRNLLTSGYIQVRKESPALTDPLVRPPEEMISTPTPIEKPTSKTGKTQIAETKVYFALSRFKEGDKPLRLAEKLYYARIVLMMMTDENKPVDLTAFKYGKQATLEI